MGSLIGGKIGSNGGQFKRENRARTRSLIAIPLSAALALFVL